MTASSQSGCYDRGGITLHEYLPQLDLASLDVALGVHLEEFLYNTGELLCSFIPSMVLANVAVGSFDDSPAFLPVFEKIE